MKHACMNCKNCRCVRPTPVDQYLAIQDLVRPWEVADLVDWSPGRCKDPLPLQVAIFLKNCFKTGELQYLPDPAHCDLWRSPAQTRLIGGGDCEDLSILAVSLLLAAGGNAWVTVGRLCQSKRCSGHAWVEGLDEHGGYLIEATSGRLVRWTRPSEYRADLFIGHDDAKLAA